MNSPRSDILERLEKASGPDRELDAAISNSLTPFEGEMYHQGRLLKLRWGSTGHIADQIHYLVAAPAFTASLDAAIALVERMLPGAFKWVCEGLDEHGSIEWNATIFRPEHERASGDAPTACLALLTALFRALEAKG